MNAWQAFHFLRPYWLLAVLALPLLWRLARRGSETATLERLADPELLPHLLQRGGRRGPLRTLLLLATWTLATLALAGPAWERLPQPVYADRAAQVVAVSLSQRMLARDMRPDRMARARYKVRALLHANADGQNGLVAYAGEAFTVAPLTADAGALDELVAALSPQVMPVAGDDAAAAIRRAARLLQEGGARDGQVVVVDDHADAAALDAAREVHDQGVRVSVLGVGTEQGGPVALPEGGFLEDAAGRTRMVARDDASLRALARAGGGRYVALRADGGDVRILRSTLHASSGAAAVDRALPRWRDRGPWLLWVVLPLAALAFRRGALLLLPIGLCLAWSRPALAGSWQDAWHTRDQQAATALASGRYRQAQKLAHDPMLRGSAAYRAGDFKAAAKAFGEAAGAQARYNQGNALARMGRYDDALKAYDRALAADPGLADAKANRRAVAEWLRSHRPPSSKSGQGGGRGGGGGQAGGDADAKSGHQSGRGDGKPGTGRRAGAGGDAAPGPATAASRPAPPRAGSGGARQPSPAAPDQASADAEKAAREALRRRMDRQLGKRAASPPGSYALGARKPGEKGEGARLPVPMQQALERVPDDPGGLLRRKFMLEYQRRHDGGGDADGE